jgi:hypothetical protein
MSARGHRVTRSRRRLPAIRGLLDVNATATAKGDMTAIIF